MVANDVTGVELDMFIEGGDIQLILLGQVFIIQYDLLDLIPFGFHKGSKQDIGVSFSVMLIFFWYSIKSGVSVCL